MEYNCNTTGFYSYKPYDVGNNIPFVSGLQVIPTLPVKIKQVRDGRHPLPKYATAGSAGVDFYAYINCSCGADDPKHSPEGCVPEVVIDAGQQKLIPLGIAVQIPRGYYLQLSMRSGLALKKGLQLTNSVGVIDSDYANEVGAIVYNSSKEPVTIKDGDRLVQGVFLKYEQVTFNVVDELDETTRTGGYGSSGM